MLEAGGRRAEDGGGLVRISAAGKHCRVLVSLVRLVRGIVR